MQQLIAEYNEAIERLGQRIDELSQEPRPYEDPHKHSQRITLLEKERCEMMRAVADMKEYI